MLEPVVVDGDINVGGVLPFTLVDFPGHIAAVVFCRGCPWRCGYCYNSHLQQVSAKSSLSWSSVAELLKARIGFLNAVVFSGGEPLLQLALQRAMENVLSMGFKVGLHTSGALPERLAKIIHLVHWVGFDVKAPFEDYEQITKVKDSGAKALESLEILLHSQKNYEVRTTVDPKIFNKEYLYRMTETLSRLNVKNFVLQAYQSFKDKQQHLSWQKKTFFENPDIIDTLKSRFVNFSIRGI